MTIKPELMTFKEYLEVVNPSGKGHPDSAYNNWTVEDEDYYMNQYDDVKLKELGYKPIKSFMSRGVQFIVFHAKNSETFRQDDFKIYDVTHGKVVGSLQDEWGTVLIMVPHEYRDFGIGKVLSDLALQYHVEKDSGGFTHAGYESYRKAHARRVQEAISSGMYRKLVKEGKITPERVKEIVGSVSKNLVSQIKFDSSRSVISKPEDWLLMLPEENSEFIIYDKKLYDIHDKGELAVHNGYWTEKLLIGTAYVQDMDSYTRTLGYLPFRIMTLYGVNDKIRSFMLMLLKSQLAKSGYEGKFVFRPEEIDVPSSDKWEVKDEPRLKPYKVIEFSDDSVIDYSAMVKAEAKYRRSRDKYGEIGNILREMAATYTK